MGLFPLLFGMGDLLFICMIMLFVLVELNIKVAYVL